MRRRKPRSRNGWSRQPGLLRLGEAQRLDEGIRVDQALRSNGHVCQEARGRLCQEARGRRAPHQRCVKDPASLSA
jgi:hypothetical protein